MSSHHRENKRLSWKAEEHIPLTSDQDDVNNGGHGGHSGATGRLLEEGQGHHVGLSSMRGHSDPAVTEAWSSTGLRTVDTEPVLSRNTLRAAGEVADTGYTRLSFMHDDGLHSEVDKMFGNSPWPFESSTTLTTDPNCHAPVVSPMSRECSKLALSEFYHVDEAEYSRHRRVSYPHIHQPLRSLSSKSLTKSAKAIKLKKKHKKKKKKEKMRSFPSRNAIQSPPIVEEDEDAHKEYSSSSVSENSDSDDDERLNQLDTDEEKVDERTSLVKQDKKRPVSPTSVTPSHIPPTSAAPSSRPVISSTLPKPDLSLLDDLLIVESGDETKGQGQGQGQQPPAPPAIPPPPRKERSPSKEKSKSPSPEQQDAKDSSSDQHAAKRPSSFRGGVGFFIGSDFPSPASQVDEGTGGEASRVPGIPLTFGDSEPIPSISLHQTGDSTDHQGVSDLPLTDPHSRRSMSPVTSPHRKSSLKDRVTFTLGADPSYSNFQSQLPDGEGDTDWVKGHKDEDSGVETEGQKVKFSQGSDLSSEGSESEPRKLSKVASSSSTHSGHSSGSTKRRHHHHHHHQHFRQEDLVMRRQKGSEVQLSDKYQEHRSPTEVDEGNTLNKADLDDMKSHRFEDQRGIRRHKIAKSKGTLHSIVHIGKSHSEKKARAKKFDHSPHEMFVELDELHFGGDDMVEWREKARWIKFEEDVEEGAERWGKPHVASLSFHSLLELRRGLERGSVMLDLEATDLSTIIHNVVENLVIQDMVEEEVKGKLLQTLLLKHRHVSNRSAFLKRSSSHSNLASLDSKRHQQEKGLMSTLSQASMGSMMNVSHKNQSQVSLTRHSKENNGKGPAQVEMVKVDVDNNMTDKGDGVHIGLTPSDQKKHVQDIMKRIPKGSEASTVLVGQVAFLKKPAMAFVRLAEGQVLDHLTEVPLPVRFLFVLLGPPEGGMDYHEVGRSLSTLMSNQKFHETAYRAESREQLLHAINSFLEDSIVLPPGDWDHKTLLPITHMARKRAQLRERQRLKKMEEANQGDKEKEEPPDPLTRTGCLFGGVYNDMKRRYPLYLSDITDAFNVQSIFAFIFIFFMCLSPCIAFGGLLSEKTQGMLGVSETMMGTSLFGMLYSLVSGQPLMIMGPTGPVLVFEEALFKFCESYQLPFLSVRFWVGLWVFLITVCAVALEGSFLVRYITRFTEEIFAILISIIFIYEVVSKLKKIFSAHPVADKDYYCSHNLTSDPLHDLAGLPPGLTIRDFHNNVSTTTTGLVGGGDNLYVDPLETRRDEPNTALLSLILIIGTFLIAYFLRVFRNSKFLGRSVRRALGDFGVLISLVSMTGLAWVMKGPYIQTLDIPGEPGTFQWTSPLNRTSFMILPVIGDPSDPQSVPLWIPFATMIPGVLIFILLFMETQITEMILTKKEMKLQKGSGYHLDQLVLGFITFAGGLFGFPWMCAATVRTIGHVSALSVFSRTHAPGEKPQLERVIEQRVTNFTLHLLIGLSVLARPVLQHIPVPALFGVFLYLGYSSLSGVQMFKRIKMLLMPVKYHPSISYVRKVRTIRMHKFTLIQLACLIVLIIVKMTKAIQLTFPLFLVLLVPFRLKGVSRWFSHEELEELDKEEEDYELDDEDDPDFYQQAHMPI